MTSTLSNLAGVLLYLVFFAGGLFVWPHYFFRHRSPTSRGRALLTVFLIHLFLAFVWSAVLGIYAFTERIGREWSHGLGLFMLLNLVSVAASWIVFARTDDKEN